MEKCCKCSKTISINEIGLNMKLISREPKEYYCIDCLADKLKTTKKTLEEQIEYYISIGCEMFSKEQQI